MCLNLYYSVVIQQFAVVASGKAPSTDLGYILTSARPHTSDPERYLDPAVQLTLFGIRACYCVRMLADRLESRRT